MLLNNNYLRRKIGINKTQVRYRMQMRQFTFCHPADEIRVTSQEWKPDPEVSIKHDNLYVRAWECEYEKPIFDAQNNNATPTISLEIAVQSDISAEEMQSCGAH